MRLVPKPYSPPQKAVEQISLALIKKYEDQFDAGIREKLDQISGLGFGTVRRVADEKLRLASDTFASIKSSFSGESLASAKGYFATELRGMWANKPELVAQAITVAETLITSLMNEIPIPILGSVLSKVISGATDLGQNKAHRMAVERTDELLGMANKLLINDRKAIEGLTTAVEQYILAGKIVAGMPANLDSYDDLVAFPVTVWKLRKASSSIAANLSNIGWLLTELELRATNVNQRCTEQIEVLNKKLPENIKVALNNGYKGSYERLASELFEWEDFPGPAPIKPSCIGQMPKGGAQLLGRYLALAVAQGYYDCYLDFIQHRRINLLRAKHPSQTDSRIVPQAFHAQQRPPRPAKHAPPSDPFPQLPPRPDARIVHQALAHSSLASQHLIPPSPPSDPFPQLPPRPDARIVHQALAHSSLASQHLIPPSPPSDPFPQLPPRPDARIVHQALAHSSLASQHLIPPSPPSDPFPQLPPRPDARIVHQALAHSSLASQHLIPPSPPSDPFPQLPPRPDARIVHQALAHSSQASQHLIPPSPPSDPIPPPNPRPRLPPNFRFPR